MTGFLLTAAAISLSGVLAPGPMTAATLAVGTRLRHGGAVIALGHAAIEFPLMLLIMAGSGALIELPGVKIGIGLIGGVVLLLMGVQLFAALRKDANVSAPSGQRHPFWTGVILTGGNPYFLMWWATVGLALITDAVRWGAVALGLFAVTHWLCDLVWLEALSLASFKGSKLLGDRNQKIVLAVCASMLVIFGGKFVYDAAGALLDDRLEAILSPSGAGASASSGCQIRSSLPSVVVPLPGSRTSDTVAARSHWSSILPNRLCRSAPRGRGG